MPKVYSESERENIRMRLQEEAKVCMSLYGVKKTTVDELVRRVHIPKGTFYLFYPSKEVLMFQVLSELYNNVEAEIEKMIKTHPNGIDVDTLTRWIVHMYLDMNNECLLKTMETGDYELLLKKLPKELVTAHTHKDAAIVEKITALIPNLGQKDVKTTAETLQVIFVLLIYRKKLPVTDLEQVLYLLIRGVMIQ